MNKIRANNLMHPAFAAFGAAQEPRRIDEAGPLAIGRVPSVAAALGLVARVRAGGHVVDSGIQPHTPGIVSHS